MFKVHLKAVSQKVILWSSLSDILTKVLTVILTNIQHHHRADENALLYFCIAQSPLVSGIRSSVHVLSANNVASIVSNFMADFHRYLSSNAEMKLNESFELYLHVASGLNISRPTNRRKAIPVRSMVGSPSLNDVKLKGSLINLPSGFPSKPSCFEDSCALASLSYKKLELLDKEKFNNLKPLILKNSTNGQKNQAGTILYDEMKMFADAKGFQVKGPHDLHSLVNQFATFYTLQVIVILSMTGSQIETFCSPNPIDFALPRIYLLLQGLNHVFLIDSVSTYFKTFRRAICFFCQKFYNTGFGKKKSAQHKCRSKLCCQKCFSYLLQANTVRQPNESWQMCDSNLTEVDLKKCCPKCGFFFKTEICFINHQLYCSTNQYYYLCPVCAKSIAMAGRDVNTVLDEHKCNENVSYCDVCCKMLTANHACTISKTKEDSDWPNLGVLSVAYQNGVAGLCQVCYQNRTKYMEEHSMSYSELLSSKLYADLACVNHRERQTHVANVITLFYEKKRFEFSSRVFSTDNFLAACEEIIETNFGYCEAPRSFTGRKRKLRSNQLEHSQSAGTQLINFLLNSNLSNYVFLVQSNAEMLTLLEIFLNYYQPSVVQHGRNLKKIDVKNLDVSFILFENYCQGNLYNLLRQFDIDRSVAYFPESFNDPKFHGQTIPKPHLSWFFSFNDDEKQKADKKKFYAELPINYNINQQLNDSLAINLKSFLLIVLKFVKMCFELQSILCTLTSTLSPHPPIHPFKKVLSLSGFAMAICKYFYLNRYQIGAVPKPYTGYCSKTSSNEYQYVSFLAYCRPDENIKHAFNSEFGQKTFGKYPVDAYGENSKVVYQYNSCELHGHTVPACTKKSIVAKGTSLNSKNCYGKLISDIHCKEDQDKTILLSKFGDQIKNFDVMWDCTFETFKKNNKEIMEDFWIRSGLPKLRPLSRLNPRASVRGGLLEVYRLSFKADANYDLHYFDMNAQYSHIALQAQMPLGKCKIYLEHELKDCLKIQDNKLYINNESCKADIAHITFVVPSDLFRPFLPIRIGENCYYANCYSCLVQANCKPCSHKSDDKRKFSSTYTVLEIEKALQLNYRVTFHELWHYSQTDNVLNEFVSLMASYRLRYSTNLSEDKKDSYCDLVNAKMNFRKPELVLSPSDINFNPAQKQLFKSILNSVFGRFALNTNYTRRCFKSSPNDVNSLIAQGNKILELLPVSDRVMQVEYLPNITSHASRDSNLFFTSIINASARILMYEIMEKLSSLHCIPLYCDTDGLIFASPKNFTEFPFEIGPAFGQFKPVLENACLKKYFSLGPRNYALVYEQDGELKYLTKIKGICITSENLQSVITPSVYEDFIDAHFKNEVKSMYIPQMKKRVPKELNSFQYQLMTHKFSNEIHIKRFVLKSQTQGPSPSHVTYSYGFNFKNMDWK